MGSVTECQCVSHSSKQIDTCPPPIPPQFLFSSSPAFSCTVLSAFSKYGSRIRQVLLDCQTQLAAPDKGWDWEYKPGCMHDLGLRFHVERRVLLVGSM